MDYLKWIVQNISSYIFSFFLNCYIRHFTIPPSTKVNKKALPRMITLYIFVFSLFATCKVIILDSFRDFDYLYENNLQTKCKQFGLLSYLCKSVKSLKVLILCIFSTAIFVLFTTATWFLFWLYSTTLISIFTHYIAYFYI